jgi:hypothetical protein
MRMLVCSRTRQVLAVPESNAVVFTNFYALDQTGLRLLQHPLDLIKGRRGVLVCLRDGAAHHAPHRFGAGIGFLSRVFMCEQVYVYDANYTSMTSYIM